MSADLPKSITFDDVAAGLSSTIKRDYSSKVITFCALILAKTANDQINIGFQSESAAGKTYIPLEVASYFPQEDIITIAGASPTAFFHEYGEWDEDRKVNVVNLEGKVLIFLDSPDYRLIEKLRSLLSHDKKRLIFKITDKSEKRGLRTKTVEIVGYPVVIYCSTKLNADEQEKTRLLLLSPEVDQDKLDESLKLIALKVSDRAKYEEMVRSAPGRKWLEELASRVWRSGFTEVRIPSDLFAQFVQREPRHKPRHQRDLPRIAALIKASALINFDLREAPPDGVLVANEEDVKAGFRLYDSVWVPNELGISPYVMDIYQKVFVPLFSAFDGVPRREIWRKHYEVYGRMPNSKRYETEIFPSLTTAGLVVFEADPNDKRRWMAYPPHPGTISFELSSDLQAKNDSQVRGVDSPSSGSLSVSQSVSQEELR